MFRKPESEKGDNDCSERRIKDDGKCAFYVQVGRIQDDREPDSPADQETGSE